MEDEQQQELPKKKPKMTITWAIVILVVFGGAVLWYFLTQDSVSTGTNTNIKNTEATNTTYNTNETSMTNTASGQFIDSRAAASGILKKAQEIDPNAQLHYLTSIAAVNQVNNLDMYSGYANGMYSSWAAIVYYPSTGMAVTGTWLNGIAVVEDPHPDASPDVGSSAYNLNYLATSESSSVIFNAAVDAGLDPVNYYVEMDIMSSGLDGADPDWQVYELDRTEIDEFGLSAINEVYFIDPHTGDIVLQ